MKTADVQYLVESVERASLGNIFYHGRKAGIERTVSIKLLTRLCRKGSILNSDVAWAAFSPGLDRDLDWHLALVEQAPTGPDVDVDQVAAPGSCVDLSSFAPYAERVDSEYLVKVAALDDKWRTWEPISSHRVAFLSLHVIGKELEREIRALLAGWVIFGVTEQGAEHISVIRETLEGTFRNLRDRLRLLAAARPSDTRLLSLADFDGVGEGYSILKLERSNELIGSIKSREGGESAGGEVLGEGPWFSEEWYSQTREALQGQFAECLRQKGLKEIKQVELGKKFGDFRQGYKIPGNEFIGIAEVSGGHAVLSIADSREVVIKWMVKLTQFCCDEFEIAALVVVVPQQLVQHFQEHLKAWGRHPPIELLPLKCQLAKQRISE